MSKVKIAGHASGSGTLTIQAPDTSSSRTITLPDETGTLSVGSSIDDNGNATAITIDSDENVEIASTVNPRAVKLYTKGNADIMDGSLVFSKPDSGTYNWRVLPNNITTGDLTFQVTSDTNTNETTQASTFVTKLQLTADGRGLSQFTAKSWVNFNGTGTVAIRDSHNVSSITDNGTGDYTVTFDNDFSYNGANIITAAKGSGDAGSNSINMTGLATSYRRFTTGRDDSTRTNLDYISCLFFGD